MFSKLFAYEQNKYVFIVPLNFKGNVGETKYEKVGV